MGMVTVIRGAGDKTGDPIVDELLSHDSARIERGRVAIDLATPSIRAEVTIRRNTAWREGDTARVYDGSTNWIGVVEGISHHSGPDAAAHTRLVIRRPRLTVNN